MGVFLFSSFVTFIFAAAVLFINVNCQYELPYPAIPRGVERPWVDSIQLINAESRNRLGDTTVKLRKRLMGNVPIIPDDVQTPKWIPGELIATEITNREIKLIDESQYGPLKSVTKFPSILSAILVFNKRYHPERLSEVLKSNFSIETVPNGIITEDKEVPKK